MSSSTEFWHLIIRHVLGMLNGGWRKIVTKYSTILLLLQKHGVRNKSVIQKQLSCHPTEAWLNFWILWQTSHNKFKIKTIERKFVQIFFHFAVYKSAHVHEFQYLNPCRHTER